MGEANRRRQAGRTPRLPIDAGFMVLEVGQPVPEVFKEAIPQDGGAALVLAKDQGIILLVGMPDITSAEARAIRKEPIKLGILPVGDALFLVMEVQGFATLDLPYNHRKVEAEYRGLPERLPHQGLGVHVVAFDALTGILKGQRFATVTPEFSAVLEAELARLDKRVDGTEWFYDTDVLRAYSKWFRPDEMLAAAKYRETAGMPFPQERQGQPAPKGAH